MCFPLRVSRMDHKPLQKLWVSQYNKDRTSWVGTMRGYCNHTIYHNNETVKSMVRTMHYMANQHDYHQHLKISRLWPPCRLAWHLFSVIDPLHSINCVYYIAVLLGIDVRPICLQFEAVFFKSCSWHLLHQFRFVGWTTGPSRWLSSQRFTDHRWI